MGHSCALSFATPRQLSVWQDVTSQCEAEKNEASRAVPTNGVASYQVKPLCDETVLYLAPHQALPASQVQTHTHTEVSERLLKTKVIKVCPKFGYPQISVMDRNGIYICMYVSFFCGEIDGEGILRFLDMPIARCEANTRVVVRKRFPHVQLLWAYARSSCAARGIYSYTFIGRLGCLI